MKELALMCGVIWPVPTSCWVCTRKPVIPVKRVGLGDNLACTYFMLGLYKEASDTCEKGRTGG